MTTKITIPEGDKITAKLSRIRAEVGDERDERTILVTDSDTAWVVRMSRLYAELERQGWTVQADASWAPPADAVYDERDTPYQRLCDAIGDADIIRSSNCGTDQPDTTEEDEEGVRLTFDGRRLVR